MTNLIEDVSVLTDVSENLLKKFIPVCTYAIGHAVHEQQCSKQDLTEIDLGIGMLKIQVTDAQIKYRFIPDKLLEKTLIQTVTTRRSPLLTKLDCNLDERLQRTYRELL